VMIVARHVNLLKATLRQTWPSWSNLNGRCAGASAAEKQIERPTHSSVNEHGN
jgi:hypothetical protein